MNALHLVRIPLNRSKVVRRAYARGLPRGQDDLGYAIHGLLRDLFGNLAPKPFVVPVDGRAFPEVLGYAPVDHTALQAEAQSYASPESYCACDWAGFASKPMPQLWRSGQRLGFQLRACPIRRLSRTGAARSAMPEGAEVDAFIARCIGVGKDTVVDRMAVYAEWLHEQIPGEAARLRRLEVRSFRRINLVRRTQGGERKAKRLDRPDVLFEGELSVVESEHFNRVLTRGIGRHRAFGFGMLLLRRTGQSSC